MRSIHCEKCGVEDTGFNLESHLACDALLCSACIRVLIREWKKLTQQTIQKGTN